MNYLLRLIPICLTAVTTAMATPANVGGTLETILVGQVIYDRSGHPDWEREWPLTVIFTGDNSFNKNTIVRHGFFAIPIPAGPQYTVWLAGSRVTQYIGEETVRDEGPWTGPTWLSAPSSTHSATTRALPVNLAERGNSRDSRQVIGVSLEPLPPELVTDLEAITRLAIQAPAAGRDSVLWSLTYLRAKYLDDRESLSAVARTESLLRRDRRTEGMFNEESKASYAAFRAINAARFGRGAPIAASDLQKIFVEPQMFITARDEALRLHAASRAVLSESGWTAARKLAEDGSSPLVYSANLACARSPKPEHQTLVLSGIDSNDPWRYEASLMAATRANLPEAKSRVARRASTLPDDPAMKKATIQFLGAHNDADSVHAIARFLDDNSLDVSLSARNELKKKGPAALPRTVQDAINRIDERKLNTVQPHDLERINLIRRDPRKFQP